MSLPSAYNIDAQYSIVSSNMDTNVGSKPCTIKRGNPENVINREKINNGDYIFEEGSCNQPPFSTNLKFLKLISVFIIYI